ncbi:hypothetical protein [Yoonia sp. MH D7]
MSIKKFSLIAATLVATASTATAGNYFAFGENREAGSTLELGNVTSEANGVVRIYNYSNGQQGALLGSKAVLAGANSDVRVNVGNNNAFAVLAVLEVDGQAVTTKDYDIKN